MRRVLLIAYYFPPSVDAGAKRALGFARHLGAHGFDVTVLTVRDGNYATAPDDAWEDGPEIVRVPEERFPWQNGAPAGRPEAAASSGASASALRQMVRTALYVPDAWRGFRRPAVRRALALHAEHTFDVVWTTSSPWTLLGVGAALRDAGLPWVADLRDLWLQNQYGYPHGRMRRAVDARLERDWLARADAITTTTDAQAELLRTDAFGPPVHTVRNGFLATTDAERDPCADADRFRIVFAGKLYAHADHSAVPFLNVLAAWRERAPDEALRVRADFYGRVDDGFDAAVAARGLTEIVHFHGLVGRDRVAAELADADVALVLVPRAHREIVVTKLYDALGALTPVLLLGPTDGEAAEILCGVGGGVACESGDTGGALAWLRARAAAGRTTDAERATLRERVAPYAYASLAGELASVLDGAIR